MEADSRPDYQIIDNDRDLADFAKFLENERMVAVDLEADSMYHFREKVCLIQITAARANIIVDPLEIEDLSPLEPLFSRHDIRKIFHGADYDVRSLHRDFGIEIHNLFDTQIACRFLGFRETGLESVLYKYFNITLDKKYQRKDWSKRPLPRDMLEYAAMDTVYLIPLAQALKKELEEKGRLVWVYEECEELSKARADVSDDEPLYLKFKGAGRLRPKTLAVLEALLQFRKAVAEKKDKPLFKIFGNDSLMQIAKTKPGSIRRLEKISTLSRKQLGMYGRELTEVVEKAMETPEKELPVYPRKKGPVLSPKVPERVRAIKRWRDAKARKLEMDFGLVSNKSLISEIAVRNPRVTAELETIRGMRAWQKEMFGKEIVAVLRHMNR